jgi:hypothetical protein
MTASGHEKQCAVVPLLWPNSAFACQWRQAVGGGYIAVRSDNTETVFTVRLPRLTVLRQKSQRPRDKRPCGSFGRFYTPAGSLGRWIVKVVIPSVDESTAMVPPWAFTISRAIKSPRPRLSFRRLL